MDVLLPNLKIKVNDGLFQIDPFTSKLGKKIIFHSVEMITELGFEKFTFKKLGEYIGSPEASIYRYFKSKNQLLFYLISWYWGWMECRLILETANISSPIVRLEKSIALVLSNADEHLVIEEVEIYKLHQITISESIKTYLKKMLTLQIKKAHFQITNNLLNAFQNY